MPAEWRRHTATWLTWPKDPETWPDRVPEVQEIFVQMMAALTPHEVVNLLVDDAATEASVRARCTFASAANIRFHQIVTVDSWIRDYGPNFLVNVQGGLAYNDWIFNAWGDKYEELKKDNSIPALLDGILRAQRFEPGIVLEGGSIEVNGEGVVLTTEQCLLNPNRNPGLTKSDLEKHFQNYLGVSNIIWLPGGIAGDDTDGHIDNLARFIDAGTVVCAYEENENDENHAPLRANYEVLKNSLDQEGNPLKVIRIPMPPARHDIVRGKKTRLPESHLNFYIGNYAILLPTFRSETDEIAARTLQEFFPKRSVIGIDCHNMIYGAGSLHCISQQQPQVLAKSQAQPGLAMSVKN